MLNQEVIIEAETEAIQIPAGNALVLPEGSRIYITQQLGSTITAASDVGLVRITKKEARRVGILPPEEAAELPPEDENLTLEERVWKTLREIYDPEIPVDIVNLGLVYGVEVIALPDGTSHVNIQMTLTAPGCAFGPQLLGEAESNAAAIAGVSAVDVDLVWDPPWNQGMMSEEARMELGYI